MFSNEALIEKWDEIPQRTNSYIRIDADHSLEWHIGYEGIGLRSLLLVTECKPDIVPSSKSIIVASAQRADSKWALTFKLVRQEQEDVYIRLCCDLIEASRNQRNTAEGLKFVLDRYSKWTKLMELQKSGVLSEAERKGLLGEISFLQQLILKGTPHLNAVTSWIGPEDADQDFIDPEGWHEIKAPGIGSKTITISSLEQLDAPPPGELVLFLIDRTAPDSPNAFTLNSKVDDLRDMLKGSPAAFDLFNTKLLSSNYINHPDYDKQWYRLGGVRRYRVDESFPKLTKDNVQSQIESVSYQISIHAIEIWRLD